MTGKEAALVFQRMAKGHVSHVVQQGRGTDGRLLLGGHRKASAAQTGDDAMGQGADANGVIEARVQGTGDRRGRPCPVA